jgi:phage terminase large subunit-like protein
VRIPKAIKDSIPFQYAYQVEKGEILTGQAIKLAVQRFFQWIKTAKEDGFWLDHQAGFHVIMFFEYFLAHTKGQKAGTPMILSPYQQFTLYNIFAWKDLAGNRRIKTVYEKVGRKNGKTAGLSGLGLYCLTFDASDSPEVYVGATKEAQAKILWQQAADFVYKSLYLRQIGCRTMQAEIKFSPNMGSFKFLGGDSKTQDGLSPTLAIIDEYHAFKDDSVREVLESAMGARQNPLIYIITTAGFNLASACRAAEEVYMEILQGVKKDDHSFIMIHDLDPGDDWEDESTWIKANPNLHHSISLEYLRGEFIKAKNQPSKIPNFKTKHLNMWVDAPEIRIAEEVWQKSSAPIQIKNFLEYGCAAAMDLSSTEDLTALVFVSNPDPKGIRDILPFFFCPFDTIDRRSKEDRVPYRFWKDKKLKDHIDFTGTTLNQDNFWQQQSLLEATPGNVIDYQTVKDFIGFTNEIHRPKWWEYDPWAATHIVQDLTNAGIKMHPFPQNVSHFSAPTKEFERLAYQGTFRHGGHPILKWMLSGCVAYTDPNENIRYVKNKSKKRIDGIIATIMALAGTITTDNGNQSKYNNDNEKIFI